MWLQLQHPKVSPPKLLAILLKDAFDRCFFPASGYPETRQNTRRLRLSFSLNDVNQQQGHQGPHPKPGGAENPGSPSQDTRTATPNLSAFGTKARRAQAPRPSVTRLIWRPSPDCQHRKTKNLQENDKCLKCNLHSVVTKAARQAGFGDLPPWISSSRSKTSASIGNRVACGPVGALALRLP